MCCTVAVGLLHNDSRAHGKRPLLFDNPPLRCPSSCKGGWGWRHPQARCQPAKGHCSCAHTSGRVCMRGLDYLSVIKTFARYQGWRTEELFYFGRLFSKLALFVRQSHPLAIRVRTCQASLNLSNSLYFGPTIVAMSKAPLNLVRGHAILIGHLRCAIRCVMRTCRNELAGVVTILRYLARAGSSAGLYGSDALSSTQVRSAICDFVFSCVAISPHGSGLQCIDLESSLSLKDADDWRWQHAIILIA